MDWIAFDIWFKMCVFGQGNTTGMDGLRQGQLNSDGFGEGAVIVMDGSRLGRLVHGRSFFLHLSIVTTVQ